MVFKSSIFIQIAERGIDAYRLSVLAERSRVRQA
jgi:hypothetical protein